jgi:preprotein translocase subunit SecE
MERARGPAILGIQPKEQGEMFEQVKAFFTEARSEFKKISWPSWDEIKGSTAVVCVTIGFLMALLFLYDSAIAMVLKLILKTSN